MTPLTVSVGRRADGTPVVKAAGEIDMSNNADLAGAFDSTEGRLVVDLTEVDYLDSAGLSLLFANAERIEVIAGPVLVPVLTVSGLTAVAAVRTVGEPADDA